MEAMASFGVQIAESAARVTLIPIGASRRSRRRRSVDDVLTCQLKSMITLAECALSNGQ